MRYLTLFVFTIFCTLTFSQYVNTKSCKPIPEDFILTSIEKTSRNLNILDSTSLSRRSKKEFYLESSFVLSELYSSGLILFNEPISNYINEVSEVLLEGDSSLKEELDFYVIRSTSINAFATNDGNVFVTLGLIAKLNTEGELASVLTHEIIHFKEKHSINSYEFELEEDNEDLYKMEQENLESVLLARSLYSQENELEADRLGLELFLKSNYNPKNVISAFKALETVYIPFKITPISSTNVGLIDPDAILELPARLDTIDQFVPSEIVSKYNSHPHISKRILITGKYLESIKLEGVDFVLPESRFNQVSYMAKLELCDDFLFERKYIEALAVTTELMKFSENDTYLESIRAKAWYGIYETKKGSKKYTNANLSSVPECFAQIIKIVNHNELDTIRNLSIALNSELSNTNDHHRAILNQLEGGTLEAGFNVNSCDSILFIDPFYFRMDLRKKTKIMRYMGSERVRSNYASLIQESCEKLDLNSYALSSTNLSSDQIEDFNSIGNLKRFLINVYENDKTEIDIISNNYNELKELEKRGVRYVGITGGFSLQEKKSGEQWTILAISAIAYPVLPLGLVNFLNPNFHSVNFLIVYDIQTGKKVYEDKHYSQLRDTDATIRSVIFYNLFKMKNGEN